MSIIVISCDKAEQKGRHYQMNPKTENPKQSKSTKVSTDNDVIMVYSFTGKWKINYGSGTYEDGYCVYEIFYTKKTNKYELKLEGYQPKNHGAYKDVKQLMIDIEYAAYKGKNYEYIRENIINLLVE